MLRPIKEVYSSTEYPDLMVGLDSPDDAAIWWIDAHRAIVLTTDFFTPVVDDPYDYGAIAAANSISDIYAMGGTPFLALNIAAFPPKLPSEILAEIIRGGAEKAREAGVVIAGGHTVQDEEPKYGLVVIGFVDPDHLITKGGAKPGDQLVLTKPLGFGITNTAIKDELTSDIEVAEVVDWMKQLNQVASQLAVANDVRGGTDITGFSLLGHASEVARASRVGMQLSFSKIPFVSGARKYAELYKFPGGAFDNRSHFREQIHLGSGISETEELMLYDPQTSGGLLLAIPPDKFESFQTQALKSDQSFWKIGEVISGHGIEISR